MVINSRTMGISQPDPELTSHDGALDEQYHRIKNDPHNTAGCPYEGTTQQITELHMRHFIMRETPRGSLIATWVNAMNEVAEGTRLGIPVLAAANSKNELGGFKLGSTPNDQDFTQWPGTLGLAATGDLDLIADFAAKSRAEWVASGLRKGYMYMADTVTDPRWFRGNGTFGEDPDFNAAAIAAVVRGFQGEQGLEREGRRPDHQALPGRRVRARTASTRTTTKGKFNVYPTPGSLAEVSPAAVPGRHRCRHLQRDAVLRDPVGGEVGDAAAAAERVRAGRFRLQHRGARPAVGRWGTEATSTPTPASCPRWPGASTTSVSPSGSARR